VTIIVKFIAGIWYVFYIFDAKKRAGKRGGGAWPRHSADGPGVPSGDWRNTYWALTFDHESMKKNIRILQDEL
jgi:hypothetical protein